MAYLTVKMTSSDTRPPSMTGSVHESRTSHTKSTAPRIVLIDPNEGYRTSLAAYLGAHGFIVTEFDDPIPAIEHIVADGRIDAILIATELPGMTGIDVLMRLQNLGVQIPIALIAAAHDQIHEETALEYGAVDFLVRTRSPSILAKRLRLMVDGVKNKTSTDPQKKDDLVVGSLRLKLRSHRALWADRLVPLTVTEFKIVRLLACNVGREVTYREIYDVVHGTGFIAGEGNDGYRSNVRSLIRNVRNKFRGLDRRFSEIENQPGLGYRWRSSRDVAASQEFPDDQESKPLQPSRP